MQTTLTDDLEYPRPAPPKCYALWCPLLDCFLWVHTNIDFLLEIQLLSSSKILTVPVELNIDLLWQNDLDNSCCLNWTVQDPDLINFTFVYQKPNHVWTCQAQLMTNNSKTESMEIQNWIRFLIKWVNWVKNKEEPQRIKNFICFTMNLPNSTLKQKIYKILLLAHSQDEAEKQIQHAIKNHEL